MIARPHRRVRLWIVRGLSALAAGWLIAAFALALMLPVKLSLAQFIERLDHGGLAVLQALVRDHLPDWAWEVLSVPLLARPVWLAPLALGLVCGGAAASVGWPSAATSHRWRD